MRTHHLTGRLLPPRQGYLRSVALRTGMGLGVLLLAGCSTPADPGQPATVAAKPVQVGQSVEVAEAHLTDKRTTEGNGQISWTTTWRVCFKAGRADTQRLEAQAVTTEGSGTSLRELEGRCLKLEVARGRNDANAGMLGRDAQLADAAALSYRVRAVHKDGTVTPWTAPILAGSTKP